MKILIVDDKAFSARVLQDNIQSAEPTYYIDTAFTKDTTSAQERALCIVKNTTEPFDVFLIDDHMGRGVNGSELMLQLRQISPVTEAIIFTADADDAGKQRAIEGGARAYVPRPVNEKELLWQLRGIQRDQRARKERDWLKLLAETTEEMQQATTIQAVGDAIVQGVKQLGFQRARLRVVSNGTGEQMELIGLSEIGASPFDKEYKTIKRSLQDLPYSRKVLLDTKRPTLFHGRELGPASWDEYVMPPKDEWFKTPLFMGEKPIGTLSLDNGAEPRKYTDEEQTQLVQLLELFSRQAATALERARLYQQTDEQAKEAGILSDIGRRIMTKATNGKLDDLLDEVKQQVGSLMDVSNFMVVLSDLETDALDFRRQYEENEETEETEETDPEGKLQDRHWRASNEGLSGYVITHNEPILTSDTDAFCTHHHLKLYGRRAECWLGVPLRLDPAKAFGALIIQSYQKKDFYTAEQQQLLGKIADQIAGAIHAAYQREREEEKKRQDKAANRLNEVLPRLIEESEDAFWHAVLTTITHKEGNSFNRALLFLQSPASDGLWIGRMAVGHWTREDARRAWERDRDDNNKTLQDYFAAPYLAFSNPTPLQQKVLQWRLTPQQVEMLRLSERKTTTSSKLEGALPERELLRPPDGLLDGATDYDCALLPIKQGNTVIGVLWVDNAFDGEPLRGGDLDKVEELLAKAVEVWQQAQERNQSRLLGEKYENILALTRQILQHVTERPLKESLEDLCKQAINIMNMKDDSIVIYPYISSKGGYDLDNIAYYGLKSTEIFRNKTKNKPRQQGVTFSVLQSGTLAVSNLTYSNLTFAGRPFAEHDFIQREGIKAVLAVPMLKAQRGEPLGVIYFDYRSTQTFTEKDIACAEHLATIGATAISYAREKSQDKESLIKAERMTQSITRIQTQALSSDSDEEKVVRSILKNADEAFNLPVRITLALLNWEEGEQKMHQQRKNYYLKQQELECEYSSRGDGSIGQAIEQDVLYHCDQDLAIVIKQEKDPIGGLGIQLLDKESRFSKVDIENIEGLATASALALDNMRTRDYLRTVSEIVSKVSVLTDLQKTLDEIRDAAIKVAPDIDCITIWYLDVEDNQTLILGSKWKVIKEIDQKHKEGPKIVRDVINQKEPVFVSIVEGNSILDGDFTKEEKIVSVAALPLHFGDNAQPFGALFFNYRKSHNFTVTERSLFTIFAAAAATAIHNAQTLELLERRRRRFETAINATEASASLEMDNILHGILTALKNEFIHKDFSIAPYILLYKEKEGVLELPAAARKFYTPTNPQYLHQMQLPLDGSMGITCDLARQAFSSKQTKIENIANVLTDDRYIQGHENTRSELCAGLANERRLLGVLVIKSDKLAAFDNDDEELFKMAAQQVALAIDRVQISQQLVRKKERDFVEMWQSEIVHKLTGVLHSLVGLRDWLKDGLFQIEEVDELAIIINENIDYVQEMISKQRPEIKTIIVKEFLEEFQTWIKNKLDWRDTTINYVLEISKESISCDPVLITYFPLPCTRGFAVDLIGIQCVAEVNVCRCKRTLLNTRLTPLAQDTWSSTFLISWTWYLPLIKTCATSLRSGRPTGR